MSLFRDSMCLTSSVALACCMFAAGYSYRAFRVPSIKKMITHIAEGAEYKMVFAVRMDLKMGKGKAAAQCCHACLKSYQKLLESDPEVCIFYFILFPKQNSYFVLCD